MREYFEKSRNYLYEIFQLSIRVRMNQILEGLLEIHLERLHWLLFARKQATFAHSIDEVLKKYLYKNQLLNDKEHQLLQRLDSSKGVTEAEQRVFRRWTMKILVAQEVPRFVIGKLEARLCIADLYSELFRSWGEFGMANKIQWAKIKAKMHAIPLYKFLAEKLLRATRNTILAKIKSLRTLVQATVGVLEEGSIVLKGTKIEEETPPAPLKCEQRSRRYNISRTMTSFKSSKSMSMPKQSALPTASRNEEIETPQPPSTSLLRKDPQLQLAKTQSLFAQKRNKVTNKMQTLRTLYEPLEVVVIEAFHTNPEELQRSLFSRNNLPLPSAMASPLKKQSFLQKGPRLQTQPSPFTKPLRSFQKHTTKSRLSVWSWLKTLPNSSDD